ncbi:hypothetical protein E2C01_059865 [Portunus trituberculatus]|uniref:Uncharacterized protein n=1 Tax=Portunus trituberculatus TaxID=210409 RepID=A0A5B7H7E2_PORTR|nr:hypothetical protein [Portunus trituberculatus]
MTQAHGTLKGPCEALAFLRIVKNRPLSRTPVLRAVVDRWSEVGRRGMGRKEGQEEEEEKEEVQQQQMEEVALGRGRVAWEGRFGVSRKY